MEITCPSGLAGEVRKLKASEINILTDRQAVKKGETFNKLLAACWVKTTATGPYKVELGEGQSVPWDSVLVADRTIALMAIRVASYGTQYIFPVQCDALQTCGNNFEWEINLSKDLPIFDLPEESISKIAEGDNRFIVESEGKEIGFRLMTGKDEKIASKRIRNNRDKLMTTAIASRIIELDGKALNHVEAEKFVAQMDADAQWKLLEKFEAVDGGVDQLIEIECPECLKGMDYNVPLEGDGFWIPSSRKTRKQKREQTRPGRKRNLLGD